MFLSMGYKMNLFLKEKTSFFFFLNDSLLKIKMFRSLSKFINVLFCACNDAISIQSSKIQVQFIKLQYLGVAGCICVIFWGPLTVINYPTVVKCGNEQNLRKKAVHVSSAILLRIETRKELESSPIIGFM